MKRNRTFRLMVLPVLAGLILAAAAQGQAANAASDLSLVAAGNNEFALELYARLKGDANSPKQPDNLFFSPYSMSAALAMTYAGARGETEKQMANVLHFTLPQEKLHAAFGQLEKQLNAGGRQGGYELSVANALWGQKGCKFLDAFLAVTRDNYGAGLNEVDFAGAAEKARGIINKWVEEKTREKIKDLIGPGALGKLTRLVLTNAIYFKGDWASKFKKESTLPMPFHISREKSEQVPTMSQKQDFEYAQLDGVQILELPYKGDSLSMVVLLPQDVNGLAGLEDLLTTTSINKWFGQLRKQQTQVFLPKFKITWGVYEMTDVLESLGMKDAFSLPPADFSGMTGIKDLCISNVLHKAFVEVNEEGTEAAAATAIVMKATAMEMTPVFRADHPFVFVIRDNRSGSILFMGRVVNPAQNEPSRARVDEARLPQDKNGNFTILMSNQSFDVNPVDIKVYIDEKLAIDQEFDVGEGSRRQHNWQKFQFTVSKGLHRLRAESAKGQAKLEKEFEVKEKCWGVLNYWFYPDTHYEPMPKQFSFGVSDKPIGAGD